MSDKGTVRFMTASAMVMNFMVWCAPSHAQHDLYDISQTVTIEGEVAGFVVGDEYATVSMFPLGEATNSRTMWVVDWRSSRSLSGQGITAEWLKRGDRVVVTGHPYRIPGRRMMLLKTITRVSDGQEWSHGANSASTQPSGPPAPGSPNAQTSTANAPATAAPTPSPATPSPAVPDANDSPVPAASSGSAPAPAKTASSPGPQQSSTSTPKPPASATPPPAAATTAAMPAPSETLGERQAKINQDVTTKTNAIVADLKKKSDAQLAQGVAASQAASQAAAQPLAVQGQSPGASAGPAWQPCAGDLRSGASQTVVPVEFVNTSKQPRKIYWFDFAGAKVPAGTLQPGQRAPMQTYTTHAWLITDGSDNCIGTLVVSKPGPIDIR